MAFLESKHADVIKEIKEKKKIDDDLEAKLIKILEEFTDNFKVAE